MEHHRKNHPRFYHPADDPADDKRFQESSISRDELIKGGKNLLDVCSAGPTMVRDEEEEDECMTRIRERRATANTLADSKKGREFFQVRSQRIVQTSLNSTRFPPPMIFVPPFSPKAGKKTTVKLSSKKDQHFASDALSPLSPSKELLEYTTAKRLAGGMQKADSTLSQCGCPRTFTSAGSTLEKGKMKSTVGFRFGWRVRANNCLRSVLPGAWLPGSHNIIREKETIKAAVPESWITSDQSFLSNTI